MTTTAARSSRTGDRTWMSRGACLGRPDLPWIADPEHATAWELLVMGALCQDCPVLPDCAKYATRAKVTAGFWAGRNRDPEPASRLAGPGWATDPLPGLDRPDLGGAA